MLAQIEYYDNNSLINLVSILSMKPDKVIFIIGKKASLRNSIDLLYITCKKQLPHLQYEVYSVDSDSFGEVCDLTQRVIPPNYECVVDLSGGEGLMTIAGYRVAKARGLKMIYTDVKRNKIIDVEMDRVICSTADIILEDYLSSKGAYILGNSHLVPQSDQFDNLYKMSRYIFNDLKAWSNTCRYMQVTMSGSKSSELSNKNYVKYNQQTIKPSKELLEYSEKLGLIKKLRMDNGISLSFTSALSKQYMINYGVWLEVFVYIEALKIKGISEVYFGAMIDWDAYDGIEQVGNEIDIVLCKASSPIFISCKLTEPDTNTINEIVVNTKRLGGNNGKGILVTYSSIKSAKAPTFHRAKEMGIQVLDKEDILSDNFGERLNKIIDKMLNE